MSTALGEVQVKTELKPEALQQLPQELVEALKQAALTLRGDEVKKVVEEIRSEAPEVADAIVSLSDEFSFEVIQQLCEKGLQR